MKSSFTIFVTLLFIVYYITTLLFPSSEATESQRLIPQLIMTAIAFIAIAVTFKERLLFQEFYLFSPFLLLCVFQIPYIFIINGDNTLFENLIVYLKYNIAIFTLFLWFYLLQEDEELAKKCILVIFIVQIYFAFYDLYNDLHVASLESEIFDSNAGFILICCVPMTLLLPIKRLRIYLYLLLLMGCIMSGQRSAGAAAVVTAPFCFKFLKDNIKLFDVAVLSVLAVIVLTPLLIRAYENLMLRTAIDKAHGSIGSGRSIFWAITWEQFWKKDIIHILFGNGYGSLQITLKQLFGIPISSHNGWLDYLYMFGLIGEAIYIYCFFVLIKFNRVFNQLLPDYKNYLMIIAILFIVKGSTSHGFWDIGVIPLSMALAIIINKAVRKEEKLDESQDDAIEAV